MRVWQGAWLLEVRGDVMDEELKHCPFCGGKPYDAHHMTYSWWAVTCKCGAEGPSFRADDATEHKSSAYQKARAAWNSRATRTVRLDLADDLVLMERDALRREVTKLVAEIGRAADDLIEYGNARERVAFDRCAEIARNGCLVPPDGGSPTPEEAAVCDEIARRIEQAR